jgi:hypothetical protein
VRESLRRHCEEARRQLLDIFSDLIGGLVSDETRMLSGYNVRGAVCERSRH